MTPKSAWKALIERESELCFNLSDQNPLKPSIGFFRSAVMVWEHLKLFEAAPIVLWAVI